MIACSASLSLSSVVRDPFLDLRPAQAIFTNRPPIPPCALFVASIERPPQVVIDALLKSMGSPIVIWLSRLGLLCHSASFQGPVRAVSRPLSSSTSRRRTISLPGLFRICGGRVRRCVRVFLGRVCRFPRRGSLRLLLRLWES